MGELLAAIFTGICKAVVGIFVKSPQEKLGIAETTTVNQKAEITADEKEISEMRSEKDFTNRVVSDPAELERMRELLNPANDTPAPKT